MVSFTAVSYTHLDVYKRQAQNYALQLQSGALPLDLRQDKLDTISATLGVDALGTLSLIHI